MNRLQIYLSFGLMLVALAGGLAGLAATLRISVPYALAALGAPMSSLANSLTAAASRCRRRAAPRSRARAGRRKPRCACS